MSSSSFNRFVRAQCVKAEDVPDMNFLKSLRTPARRARVVVPRRNAGFTVNQCSSRAAGAIASSAVERRFEVKRARGNFA